MRFNAKNIRRKSPSPKNFILIAPSEDNNDMIYENDSKSPLLNDENGQWLRIGGGYTNVPNEVIEANPKKSKFEIAREYERKNRISGSRRKSSIYNKWTITKYDEMQKATQKSFSKGFEANQYPLSPTFNKHEDKEKKYISDMQMINTRTMTRNNNKNDIKSRGGNDESLQYYVDRKRREINTEIGVIGRKTFEKSLNQNRRKRIVDPNTYICVCDKVCNKLYPSCSECYTPNPYFNINSNNNNKTTNLSMKPLQTDLKSHSSGISVKSIHYQSSNNNFCDNNKFSDSLLSNYPNPNESIKSNKREIIQSLFPPIPPTKFQNTISNPCDEIPKTEHPIYISPKTPSTPSSSSYRHITNNLKFPISESSETITTNTANSSNIRRESLLEKTFPRGIINRENVSNDKVLEYPRRFTESFQGRGKGYNPISVTIPSGFEYDNNNNNNMNGLMFREGGEPIFVEYNNGISGGDEYDDINPSILNNARVGLVKTIV